MKFIKEFKFDVNMCLSVLDSLKPEYKSHIDLSDIGNAIGKMLGKQVIYGKKGFEYEDFIAGLEHGFDNSIKNNNETV